jgi:hypothetical protein
MQLPIQNTVKKPEICIKPSEVLVANELLEIDYPHDISDLNELSMFASNSYFGHFEKLNQLNDRIEFFVEDEEFDKKLSRKKSSWPQYNKEIKDLIRLFEISYRFCSRLNSMRLKLGFEDFKGEHPIVKSTFLTLRFCGVIDYMLYSLATNPKEYFSVKEKLLNPESLGDTKLLN